MVRKIDKAVRQQDVQGLSRREFFKQGAAVGVGAAVVAGAGVTAAKAQDGITWNYEADVVVCGAGATGLPAAIRAHDLGASVIILEQNYDIGGKAVHSTGLISLGGGDPLQLRDIAGEADKEGFITVPPQEDIAEITDDVDLLFRDMTDWSVLDAAAQAPYRYNEPDLHRGWADNCFDTRNLLLDNYVRMGRISGTHGNGGMSRARRAYAFLMESDVTDIKAGTVSTYDAGKNGADGHNSPFTPRVMASGAAQVGPGARVYGTALARPLEFSAREKGIPFIVNMHVDEVIREQPFAGRVIGVKASYSPRLDPITGVRLESFWQNGNIDERGETVYIKANKGVIIASGGHTNNPAFRSQFYHAWREPAFVGSGWAWLGHRGLDGSGIIAAQKVGAQLSGLVQNLSYGATYHFPGTLAVRDPYTAMYPGHPTYPFRGATGIDLGGSAFEHLIVVNQVGKRFFNELLVTEKAGGAAYPPGPGKGQPTMGLDFQQLDWRNASAANVRATYNENHGLYAAMAINEGSEAPTWYTGPKWAIFDSAAVTRDGWDINPPHTSDSNGYFFHADTLEELAAKVLAGHEFQRVPLTYLKETVDKWNAAAANGGDLEYGRGEDAPMWPISTPPFYAAALFPVWHDSYGGLHINGKTQVIDYKNEIIPGLFAGGEASGGGNQHGLGRAVVHGFIAGTNAAAG